MIGTAAAQTKMSINTTTNADLSAAANTAAKRMPTEDILVAIALICCMIVAIFSLPSYFKYRSEDRANQRTYDLEKRKLDLAIAKKKAKYEKKAQQKMQKGA